MSALDHATLIERMIEVGGDAVLLRRSRDHDALGDLCQKIRIAARAPADRARTIDDHTEMFAQAVQLCDRALHVHNRKRAAIYSRVIGALLPDLRDDLAEAIEQRRRPTT